MSRYIDADALLEAMRNLEDECEKVMTCPSWWSAYNVVKEQPTAYSVEAVVAELEKEKSGLTTWAEDEAFKLGIDKAIEIVRGKE